MAKPEKEKEKEKPSIISRAGEANLLGIEKGEIFEKEYIIISIKFR